MHRGCWVAILYVGREWAQSEMFHCSRETGHLTSGLPNNKILWGTKNELIEVHFLSVIYLFIILFVS